MVIPYYYFILLIGKNQYDYVCFIHHFYQFYTTFKPLTFLFELLWWRVILDDLKAKFGSYSKVFLSLVTRYDVDFILRWKGTEVLFYIRTINFTLNCLANYFTFLYLYSYSLMMWRTQSLSWIANIRLLFHLLWCDFHCNVLLVNYILNS